MEYVDFADVKWGYLMRTWGGCLVWSALFWGREGRAYLASTLNTGPAATNLLAFIGVPAAYLWFGVGEQLMYWRYGGITIAQPWPITPSTPDGMVLWTLEDQGWTTYLWLAVWAVYFVGCARAQNRAKAAGTSLVEMLRKERAAQ